MLFRDEGLSSFYGKHDVYVELGVGVRHITLWSYSINIPLLWSGEMKSVVFYQHSAPLERGK